MLQLALDSVNCLNYFCRPLSESGTYLFCINYYRVNLDNVEKIFGGIFSCHERKLVIFEIDKPQNFMMIELLV